MLFRRRLLLSSSSQTPRRCDPFDMVDEGEWTELFDYLTPTLNNHHEFLDIETTTRRRRITTRREATKALKNQQKAATMEIQRLQKTLSKRKYVPQVGTKLHFLSYVLWKKETKTNTLGRNGSGSSSTTSGTSSAMGTAAAAGSGPVPKRIIQQILNIDRETIKVSDSKGRLPLHIACMNPTTSLEVIEFLLERYGRASRIGDKEYGNVPLFYAILSACEDDNSDSDSCDDADGDEKLVRSSGPTSSSTDSPPSNGCTDDVISDSRLQVIASLLAISPQTIRHINNKYETPVDIVACTTTTARLDRKHRHGKKRSRAIQALINGVSDAYMDGSLLDEFSKEFTTFTTTPAATTAGELQREMAPSGDESTVVAGVGGGRSRGRRSSYNHIEVGSGGSRYGILDESESRDGGGTATARRKCYSNGDRIGLGGGPLIHVEKNSSTFVSLSSSSALFSDLDLVESREFQLRDNATPMPTMGTGSMLKYVLRIKK